ncbi:MAG: aminotransferase class I/II-fold pyridoxal phosphate-dependent enzyme [Caldilineaceae bacterium]
MTAFDPQRLLRPDVADMEEYTPIQPFEVLSRRLGLAPGAIVKLDANENPYGPAPGVAEALAEYPYYHIYPDPQQTELRAALSAYAGVPAVNILPSHGADEMLDYLCRLFLQPGEAIINCPPTFGMYSFDASLAGARVIDVPRLPDYAVDVDALEELFVRPSPGGVPKLLFLTAPNNPSGNWLPDGELQRLLKLPVLVVLDEAYVEFADHESRSRWVLAHENLVVLRTFSKAAGIAGLRLGYGICPDWLMAQLWKFSSRTTSTWPRRSLVSPRCAMAHLRHTVNLLKAERFRLLGALAAVPTLTPLPSEANFILCPVVGRSAADLKHAEARGILVRHYNKPGLDNCIRISVGRPDQTDRLVEALHELTE